MLCNRGSGINANKCLYEGVIVPIALHGTEAWDMKSAERRKVNVLEMKCLRSLARVSRTRVLVSSTYAYPGAYVDD